MAVTYNQLLDKLQSRIRAVFPSASVQLGWPQIYLSNNRQWPLITIAPIVDSSSPKGHSASTSTVFEIRLLEQAQPGVIHSLIRKRFDLRQALFAQDPMYGRSLQSPAVEPEALEFHEPLPNQPFAGFTLLIQMDFFESQENL